MCRGTAPHFSVNRNRERAACRQNFPSLPFARVLSCKPAVYDPTISLFHRSLVDLPQLDDPPCSHLEGSLGFQSSIPSQSQLQAPHSCRLERERERRIKRRSKQRASFSAIVRVYDAFLVVLFAGCFLAYSLFWRMQGGCSMQYLWRGCRSDESGWIH